MIENEPNELTFIYHSDKNDDKKARAFIETIQTYKVKTLDLKKEALTETQLAEIATKMNVNVKALIDPTYKDRFESSNPKMMNGMSDNDLLITLKHEPILLNTPITIIGKKAYTYASAYDLLNKNTTTEGVERNADANKEEKRTPL
ncbi:MAG: hypothetical protein HOP08_14165 [Cyclobacteriaceae bacterium]|nr:hypothetical protein [Cyclobacteriaceae bacterium]